MHRFGLSFVPPVYIVFYHHGFGFRIVHPTYVYDMKNPCILFHLLWLWVGCVATVKAQTPVVALRVDGREVLRDELESDFRRHVRQGGSHLSASDYAAHRVDELLMTAEARRLGLDTLPAFRARVAEHRNRLLHAAFAHEGDVRTWERRASERASAAAEPRVWEVEHWFHPLNQQLASTELQRAGQKMDEVYETLTQSNRQSDAWREHRMHSVRHDSSRIAQAEALPEWVEVLSALEVGGLSKPFYSPEGIHIFRLLGVTSGEPAKAAFLMSRREQSRQLLDDLKKTLDWQPRPEGIGELLRNGSTSKTLFVLNGEVYDGSRFARFAESHPAGLQRQWEAFEAKALMDAHCRVVMAPGGTLSRELEHYVDTCLMMAVEERMAGEWAMDEQRLTDFFNKHRERYRWELPRYRGAVIHCADKRTAKQVKRLLKKQPQSLWEELVNRSFGAGMSPAKAVMEQGLYAIGTNAYVDKLVFKQGDFSPVKSYPFTVVMGEVEKIPTDFRAVEKSVRTDLKEHLRAEYMRNLRHRFAVETNQEVIKTVKNSASD